MLAVFGLVALCSMRGQHLNVIEATLTAEDHAIQIKQTFTYRNDSQSTLDTLFFNDWNHAYASKKSALAKRFGEEFKRSLHLAKDKDRGFTRITSIVDDNYKGLEWSRAADRDIVKIALPSPLSPGNEVKLFLTYTVDLPNSKFTRYGHGYLGGYFLRDWYLTPALFDGEWKLYPNKDLNDLATEAMNTRISLKYPNDLFIASNF